MRTVQFFDTTLRDGEQSPGVNLSAEEKVTIALQLERLGIHVIEAGFAASSQGDLEAVRRVGKAVKNSTVVSLARSVPGDIEKAWEALKEAENPGLHIFLATSPIHRKYKLNMTREEVLEQAEASVRLAKKYFPKVEFSTEDGGRTEKEFLCQVAERVIDAGADVLNIPDTVGYLTPQEYGDIFRYLRARVRGIEKVKLSAHCHDDLGMAVANTLAAIEAGVEQVEGTINGIGERAGNAALEEVAMALATREDHYRVATGLQLKEIAKTSRMVSKMTGMLVPGNKAVVGANAFAHEAGIHQDGMLKNSSTYEIMRPETIGQDATRLVLGKHSGRHAFRDKLKGMGYELTDQQINQLFVRFKELTDRKKTVEDEDIASLVEEKWAEEEEVYTLETVQLSYGNQSVPTASVRVLDVRHQRVLEEAACGNGSVDAIFKAIDRVTGEASHLEDFKIASVTHGKDALGEVYVKLRQGDRTVQGRGVSTDVLEASARAYIHAVNRIVARREADPTAQKARAVVSS
ncbi:2-isopropylmalate synthase [Melghirimyces profundicolus]|uniref:2-isopropylmalate synthase n=1 Tax=Melghirimyces profundicolus TaxID=1242148 RepID=A0A2T6C4D3_9BACL|nr:2-isopropylmalate synthase [Melghirimyces profundicolus]PTX63174.1 2-isopropylmalate synthase [Melghirimyces profundicolus]